MALVVTQLDVCPNRIILCVLRRYISSSLQHNRKHVQSSFWIWLPSQKIRTSESTCKEVFMYSLAAELLTTSADIRLDKTLMLGSTHWYRDSFLI